MEPRTRPSEVKRDSTPRRWLAVGLLAVAAAAIWLGLRWLPDGRLHVYFLDVGQGDAVFVVAPDGRQLLVDGGPSPTALANELGALMPFWDRSLDLVLLTHPDGDHMNGLIPLLDRYRIGQVVDTLATDDAPAAAPWLEGVRRQRIPRTRGSRGMVLDAGELLIVVLNPGPAPSPTAEDNDGSIVARLDYGQTSLLLTGDAAEDAEREMMAQSLPLGADVLKVGHHGSRYSTSPAFLDAVSPRLAVIQVGQDNRFGHPHAELLERLAAISVFRTDLHGRVEVISDGIQLWARTKHSFGREER